MKTTFLPVTTLVVSLFIIDFERLGPDWKWGNQDGGAGNIGRVFNVNGGVVKVNCWLYFVSTFGQLHKLPVSDISKMWNSNSFLACSEKFKRLYPCAGSLAQWTHQHLSQRCRRSKWCTGSSCGEDKKSCKEREREGKNSFSMFVLFLLVFFFLLIRDA